MKRLVVVFLFIGFSFAIQSQEKRIENITIKGAKKTNVSFLKNLIQSKAQQSLDSVQLEKDIILLKRLPAVSHAYFQVFHSRKNLYNVFISVEENFTIIPDINFWTTTQNRFAYKIGANEYNFLGRNITVGGFYQKNTFDSYGVNFSAPNLFSRKLGLSITHQNWKSEEPLYFENQSANYLYNNISLEILTLYELSFKHQFKVGVNFFKEKYQYLFGFTSPNVPQELNLNKFLFKTVYTYDNLDYHYFLVNGFKSTFYGQLVKTADGKEKDFLIFWNDFFYFRNVYNKGNWANRLRVGLSTNNNSPFAPFALDNNVNIRGVGIIIDRGTGTIVYNTEYRQTLIDKSWYALQANAFLDAGSWRTPGGNFKDFITAENMEIFSGIGLRFIHKKIFNAVFRIDYGVSLRNNTKGIVFGLGQYF